MKQYCKLARNRVCSHLLRSEQARRWRLGHGRQTAIHLVSAFATELGVMLGQEKTARKSIEITTIPELLEALDLYLQGFLVSIDVMNCQKDIAR